MKLNTLIVKVLDKTAPISALEKNDIEKKAGLWYETQVKKYKDAEAEGRDLTMVETVFKHLDDWYSGVALSLAYFWLVRLIQDYINPGDDLPEEGEHDGGR